MENNLVDIVQRLRGPLPAQFVNFYNPFGISAIRVISRTECISQLLIVEVANKLQLETGLVVVGCATIYPDFELAVVTQVDWAGKCILDSCRLSNPLAISRSIALRAVILEAPTSREGSRSGGKPVN